MHADLPKRSPALLSWFTWYSRRYIRKHFHALRVSSSSQLPIHFEKPLVIYTNHASWWDPLVGLVVLPGQFGDRRLYAPIEAAMLANYKMFGRMGFFGVEKDTRQGAIDFLSTSSKILQDGRSMLAVTAQGRFADVRERPANIKRGLAHLAARVPNARFIPACIEYVFWEEKLPEILVRFGEPVSLSAADDIDETAAKLERALETTQDELARLSLARNATAFEIVQSGSAGVGGVYDQWRRFKATLKGEQFRKEHSAQ